MKKLSKLTALLLAFVLCISTMSAFASELNELEQPQTYVISEEEMIAGLQSMSDEELKEQGYTDDAINEIREFDYFQALSERAALDDETLLLYGYTEEEIEDLRAYVESGGRLRKTIDPNTLTLTLTFSPLMVAGKQGTGILKWEWQRVTLIQYQDCIAVAWKTTNGSTLCYSPSNSNRMAVTYTKIDPSAMGAGTKTEYIDWKVNDYQSLYVKVALGASTNYFAYSGEGRFTMKTDSGTFSNFYIDAAYGHYYHLATPSISINVLTGSISVSFKNDTRIDDKHLKRVYNSKFKVVYNYDD